MSEAGYFLSFLAPQFVLGFGALHISVSYGSASVSISVQKAGGCSSEEAGSRRRLCMAKACVKLV